MAKFKTKMVWDKTRWVVRLFLGDKFVSETPFVDGVEITSSEPKTALKAKKPRQEYQRRPY